MKVFDALSVLLVAKILEPHVLKLFTEEDYVDLSGSYTFI